MSGGGYNAVLAEISLIRLALSFENYDRLAFLQGADYPIKSNEFIYDFYNKHRQVEFIRACKCSGSDDPYFYSKCRFLSFPDSKSGFQNIWNKIGKRVPLKLKSGYIKDGMDRLPVFWGSAQWALSGECAKYILSYFDSNPKFNSWFKTIISSDETYFATVIMNSCFSEFTAKGGPEEPKRGLSNWRNLHYFEYLPGKIRVFNERDIDEILRQPDLYVRKVDTNTSSKLLDMLDLQGNS